LPTPPFWFIKAITRMHGLPTTEKPPPNRGILQGFGGK